MKIYLKFFYEMMTAMFGKLAKFFTNLWSNFWSIFNFSDYNKILGFYKQDFNAVAWLLTIVTFVVIFAILIFILFLIIMLIRKYVKVRKTYIAQEELMDQIDELNRKVIKLIREKDYLMAMKVSQLGLKPGGEDYLEETTTETETTGGTTHRFVKLIDVDKKYNGEIYSTAYPQTFTLEKFVHDLRNFACKELKLFYEPRIIRLFVAALATSKIIILEGISGTGKTSLPYAIGKFLSFSTPIIPVQPSWRDKTELIGYLNEFTKRFNETDFLKCLYEYKYRDTVGLIVLDEMNLARIEYYFAEVLSTLEMPNPKEWTMDIVPDEWATDPVLIKKGKMQFPTNTWFVGTANNDDSTFTITDKVYDRATAIAINAKANAFQPEEYDTYEVQEDYLVSLFEKARADHPLSDDLMKRLTELDKFILTTFRITFGNRIVKQIKDFIPVYTACGGSDIDGLDFLLTTKILRKFSSLNITYEQENLKRLLIVLDRLFGAENMTESKTFISRLIKRQ